MATSRFLVGVCLSLIGWMILFPSCAPRRIVSPDRPPEPRPVVRPAPPVLPDMGDDLFRSAEKIYIQGDTDAALEAYQRYIGQFPGGAWVPESLLRIGQIHMSRGQTARALQAFQQLSDDYPNSSMAIDGEIAALRIYYQMKNYSGVIQRGNDLLNKAAGKDRVFEVQEILGDAYWSSGKLLEAVNAWDRAFQTSDAAVRNRLFQKSEEMLSRFSAADFLRLSGSAATPLFQGELLYLAALQDFRNRNFDPAESTLEAFQSRFPDHPRMKTVPDLLGQIHRQSRFQKHTIGCLLPLTGAHESYGKKALRGLELAMHQYNEAHPAIPMTVQVRDTESSPEKAGLLVQELSNMGVAAVLGPIGGAESAAQAAQENQIPILTLTQKEGVTSIGEYVFRNYITPRMQAEALAYFAAARLGVSRFGILYPNDSYGIGFRDVFRERVLSHDKQIVGEEYYDAGTVDFGEAIQRLNRNDYRRTGEPAGSSDTSGIQVLFLPDSAARAIQIIPQIIYYDMANVVLFGPNMWNTPAMLSISSETLPGMMFSDCFHAESDRETVRSFVGQFQEIYGEVPGFLEAIMYDSAMMLFSVLGTGDFRYRGEIPRALMHMPDTDGVTGPYRFSSEREAWKQMVILRISQGRFVEVTGR